ncbi:MAG: type II toxin-antitoxin system RatA family toxin [Pseudomonadota bacterium]|nr:MAG: type II toxin-antitoxin system RatA family toxin [Pseudomonadota bacterium]
MTVITRQALVPYEAEQMYRLVDNIEAYAEFLPWCSSATVLSRAAEQVEASIQIEHSGLKKSFTTRNTLEPGTAISMQLVEGPFKHLHGVWRFHALGAEGCKVSLKLEFEFSSKLLGMTFGKVFNHIAGNLVDAFIQRAGDVYG